MVRRLLIGAVAAVASLVLTAGVASAHECYISNRSAQGNQQAGTNSAVWEILTVADLANFAPPGTDTACFAAYWTSHGGPASFTVRSDKTIGENSSNPNLANGKGLEHAEDVFGPLFGAAVEACQL